MPLISGCLQKMSAQLGAPIEYHLPVGDTMVPLNALIGKPISLQFEGKIVCNACSKPTKKSYNQGYCFLCFKRLARCDMCILKPEQCHFHLGTCREPEWGEANCMIDHYVYLANTSGLKVGLTRHSQIPTRWIDQGAAQALPIIKTSSRRLAGLIEVTIAEHMSDKTDWRSLLKATPDPLPLAEISADILKQIAPKLAQLKAEFKEAIIEVIQQEVLVLAYPVDTYPKKITSIGLDKHPVIEKTLTGIKGQYLYFDNQVFNVRKHSAYEITLDY